MKKGISLLLVLTVLAACAGCGNGKDAGKTQPPVGAESSAAAQQETVDIDLTKMSSTMVYSQVGNMMNNPKAYIGKNVKMSGSFAVYQDEGTGSLYFACVIKDATACCSQGIEFVLADERAYPEEYPKRGADICVIGTYDTYQEGQYTYPTLRNARLV